MEMVKYRQGLSVRENLINPVFIKDHMIAEPTATSDYIILLLGREIGKLNFTKTVSSPAHLADLTEIVCDKYRYETLEDIVLAFKMFTSNMIPGLNVTEFFKLSIADVVHIIDTYLLEVKIPERERIERENKPKTDDSNHRKASPEQVRKIMGAWEKERREEKQKERQEREKDTPVNPILQNYGSMIKEIKRMLRGKSDKEVDMIRNTFPYHHRKFVDEALLELKNEGNSDKSDQALF